MLSVVLLVQSVMVNANAEEIADKPEFKITSSAAKGSEGWYYSNDTGFSFGDYLRGGFYS